MSQLDRRSSEYEFRVWELGDRQGFLDLYETVWGRGRRREWFRWRFEANPYLDEVPMVVADHDGEIVGAEPCLAFRLRVGDETVLAFQPADWIVHPDHRRQGVFSGMTERLLDRYDDGPPALYFNFPSEGLVPGLEKFDWQIRDAPRTHYRIQNPHRILRLGSESKREFRSIATRNLGLVAMPLTGGYLRLRDRLRRRAEGVAVERHTPVPAGLLTALAGDSGDRIHVVRDEAYYQWRFENPRWTTTTYVARRGGEPVAACIACAERRGEIQTTAIMDVVQRDGSPDEAASRALVDAVIDDADDADMVKAGDGSIPTSVLRSAGFVASDDFPVSALANQAPLAVRPASKSASDTLDIGGVDPAQRSWELALADRDIG